MPIEKPPLKRISGRYLLFEEISALLLFLFISLFPYFALDAYSVLWWSVLGALLTVYLFFALLYFPVRYKKTGYFLSEELIFYQTGFFFLKYAILARKRLIYTTMTRSPITPLLGIVSLTMRAPGAEVKIPGLKEKEAQILLKKAAPLLEP